MISASALNNFVGCAGKKGPEMMKNQMVGEGTWTLSIFVTDLQVERNLRVRGDMHIGGVMIRLVDELGRQN